eukprot:589143-Alexandrium_andersonii.AAC.1
MLHTCPLSFLHVPIPDPRSLIFGHYVDRAAATQTVHSSPSPTVDSVPAPAESPSPSIQSYPLLQSKHASGEARGHGSFWSSGLDANQALSQEPGNTKAAPSGRGLCCFGS